MDPSEIIDLGFEDAVLSDDESIHSDDDNEYSLDEWLISSSNFDNFEFRSYELREWNERFDNTEFFVNAIISAYKRIDNVSAIRLLADIHDIDDNIVRYNSTIRFEISSFESIDEIKDLLIDYITTYSAPIWHKLLSDETSDLANNKLVRYKKDYFDLCIQKPNKTRTQVTTISGEREIHPGIFVKMITDHNLDYTGNDCLIRCMNEIFNMRVDPVTIRKEIWPNGYYEKDLHTPRHINYIATRYDTKLTVLDINLSKNLCFNRQCESGKIVQLVKVGKVLGILERVDKTVDKRNIPNSVCYFDLETVGPEQNIYAFTWRSKYADMTMCHSNCKEIEDKFIGILLDTLNSIDTNGSIITYAWNGAKFDNWIVFNLLKRKFVKKLWVHSIIINSGNELLMFKLTVNDRTMIFKDPKKMFNVSIPEACKVFGIDDGKHEFNHNEVDENFSNNNFDGYINNNKQKIISYVRQDGILLEQITDKIKRLYDKEKINMYEVLSRSVASSISWQRTIEQYKILKDVKLSAYKELTLKKATQNGIETEVVKYNDIMDHAIGGRTQCIKSGTFNNICGIDVNSMYPYVCAVGMYPCGNIEVWSPNSEPPKDKLGLYYVRIKSQTTPHVIPYRKAKHYAYDWVKNGEFEKWITSIDMWQLEDYEVIMGFYWTDKTDKFYKDFMIDNYNERISIEKSNPKNLHIKLKMNGVTGSVFQHSFRELIMIFTKEELELNVKKYNELVKIIGCQKLNDREYIVTMRPIKLRDGDPRIKVQQDFCNNAITQKPWVLTMFTYSYARKLLRDEWIKLESKGCNVVYCDTDSLFFTNPGNIIHEDEYRSANKELGEWSIECWNDEGAFYTPKIYAIKNINKLRIKGVGYNSLVVNEDVDRKLMDYNKRMELYLKCAKSSKHPNYNTVVDMCNGIPLSTINFVMSRSKDKGITKDYVIKIIR